MKSVTLPRCHSGEACAGLDPGVTGVTTCHETIKVDGFGKSYFVYSEIGKGTEIKIYLPLVFAKKTEREEIISEVMHGRGEKIMVVDDDTDLLKPMEALLEFIGYSAVFAAGGEEALVKYESLKPHAVLMDRNMPEMDGITCAKKILEQDPFAKIILISGYDEMGPDGIDPRIKEIIKGYIAKPIELVELSLVLDRLFRE